MNKDQAGVGVPDVITPRGLDFLIFFTGAASLSLELLASRIMTPYFGVSLYIWAGILSSTLIFLATGYYLGGRLTAGRELQAILTFYLLAPLLAALVLLGAALIYPLIFPWLARGNLIAASFLGGSVLLALPLILLSAMNPLLIALDRPAAPGDSGAGRVFFISTLGSVVGVMVTAFLVIPNLTNFRAVLGLSLALCLAAAGTVWQATGLLSNGPAPNAPHRLPGGPAGSVAAMGAPGLSAPAGCEQRFRGDVGGPGRISLRFRQPQGRGVVRRRTTRRYRPHVCAGRHCPESF